MEEVYIVEGLEVIRILDPEHNPDAITGAGFVEISDLLDS